MEESTVQNDGKCGVVKNECSQVNWDECEKGSQEEFATERSSRLKGKAVL